MLSSIHTISPGRPKNLLIWLKKWFINLKMYILSWLIDMHQKIKSKSGSLKYFQWILCLFGPHWAKNSYFCKIYCHLADPFFTCVFAAFFHGILRLMFAVHKLYNSPLLNICVIIQYFINKKRDHNSKTEKF